MGLRFGWTIRWAGTRGAHDVSQRLRSRAVDATNGVLTREIAEVATLARGCNLTQRTVNFILRDGRQGSRILHLVR